MERRPTHFEADPSLRPELVAQESLDEFTERYTHWLEHEDTAGVLEMLRYCDIAPEDFARSQWESRLDPDTNMNEKLYLEGWTSKVARDSVLDQQQAELREAMIMNGLLDQRRYPELDEMGL